MRRVVVVTGTGTEVGKTVATAALASVLGPPESVVVVKPVQTGVGPTEPGDAEEVARLAGCLTVEHARLPDPLAPGTAARLRDMTLPTVAEHAARLRALAEEHETVVVEGAGGLLVRLDTGGGTLLGLVGVLGREQDLEVIVVVVVAAGLGTLNHAELTVSALRAVGVEPAGLVIGSWPREPGLVELCNLEDLPLVTGLPVVARIVEGASRLAPAAFREAAGSWFAWDPAAGQSPGRSTWAASVGGACTQ